MVSPASSRNPWAGLTTQGQRKDDSTSLFQLKLLPGKGSSNSHGGMPVHQIISMIWWIWTSRLLIKNPLSPQERRGGHITERNSAPPRDLYQHKLHNQLKASFHNSLFSGLGRLMRGYLQKRIQTSMAQSWSTEIISMIKWIRTSRLSIKNSLFFSEVERDLLR